MWTLAFGQHEDRNTDARLCRDARGRDGDVREELAAGIKAVHGEEGRRLVLVIKLSYGQRTDHK